MPANKKLLILAGDGIGPEVMREVRRVIDWLDRRRIVSFDISDDLVGGAAIDSRGTPITDETMQKAKDADAILFGSVGGPKWDNLGFQLRPELAILRLRKELDLFANLRPATVLDPLVDASTLKQDVIRGLDLMIVRESTGGIYFGEPRGIETLKTPSFSSSLPLAPANCSILAVSNPVLGPFLLFWPAGTRVGISIKQMRPRIVFIFISASRKLPTLAPSVSQRFAQRRGTVG
jgi:hypothetical protein